MTDLNTDGLRLPAQDLSAISPGEDDDGRLFHHDGSNLIDITTGESVSNKGFYVWDNSVGLWNPLKLTLSDANLFDGQPSSAYLKADGTNPATGTLNFETGTLTIGGAEVYHPGNKPGVADLSFDPATQVELDAVSSQLSTHESDQTNPHGVTAAQVGAIPDAIDSVDGSHIVGSSITEAHLTFDPTTQTELNAHAGDASAHHTRYSDSEAVAAVNAESTLSVNISGNADSVDGYDIQKDGTDGVGIINFKTT